MQRPKVFGVGFHKTGTKSLGTALTLLGYRTCGPMWTQDVQTHDSLLQQALAVVPDYDAFQDNPWPLLFRELDAHFPGSRFILTVCPTEEWVARAVRYFGTKDSPMRRLIYGEQAGTPVGNEEIYRQRFDAHNRAVQAHFRDRPDQLLVMPLIHAPEWGPLCRFLKEDEPKGQAFPHKNRTRLA